MGKGKFCQALYERGLNIEGTGEQCTVVFAFIVTEPSSEFVCGGGSCCTPRLPSTCRFRNILCKDDSVLFSTYRLNMELDLQSLLGLHELEHSCNHWLRVTPQPPPLPPHLGSFRRHLFVTP